MAQLVKGKTAILTGAGSGINLAFARLLLSKGCNCVFADRELRPEAQELVDSSDRSLFVQTDVRDWRQLRNMFKTAESQFKTVDIVCPGAGVFEPNFSNFWKPPGSPESTDSPTDGHYATLDINLIHPIRTTQLAIAHFLETSRVNQERKTIVHISSIAGQVPLMPTPMYAASKHAISGFVRSLAPLDEKLGIRVAAVAPGVIKTPLWTEHPEKLKGVENSDQWVTPEAVAEVMLALVERSEIVGADIGFESSTERIEVKGGLVVEVSAGTIREVQTYNDPGPSGPGNTIGGLNKLEDDAFSLLEQKGWGKSQLQ
ncbi:hypothetical protein POJ06DRAFT_283333 [Lipomyces tetrasporus]|uniref:NAD-dependent 15-hydroxyprostaglandin dehydrogenase n=1 Tax=Lipomyces tetrasporus TaxID=54092 RepID=A0AAD7VPQ7_9ASCO|nr:uncharacterized protein POJ06DRAFT_283333 [Lipomyces tetrasporus]KAJ8098062.1 hypothetical protein POJ06DRAFT_283333 [Lipomyces tetrasporus]